MKIRAIPTKYAGVQFRSRLEARWAAYFDLVGLTWEYEPFDFPGWIPDFLVKGEDLEHSVLLEVKPEYTDCYTEMCAMVRSVEAVEWAEASFDMYMSTIVKGQITLFLAVGHSPAGIYAFHPHDAGAWKEAANIVQWRSPVKTPPPKSKYQGLPPRRGRKRLTPGR